MLSRYRLKKSILEREFGRQQSQKTDRLERAN
jgi:hypothetical protein